MRASGNDLWRIRFLGITIAVALGGVLVATQVALGVKIDWKDPGPLTLIAPWSLPIGGLLALRHAVGAVRGRELSWRPVIYFALQALLLGAAAVSVTVSLAAILRGAVDGPVATLVETIQLMLLGLIWVGPSVFVVTLTVALVWAALLRFLARRIGQQCRAQKGPPATTSTCSVSLPS